VGLYFPIIRRFIGKHLLTSLPGIAIRAGLLLISYSLSAQSSDIVLLKKIYISHPTKLDGTFRLITATAPAVWIIIPFSEITVGIDTRNEGLKIAGFISVTSLISAAVLQYELKHIVRRKRPFNVSADINPKEENVNASNFSFPSGHTAESFALATSLSLEFPKWYIIAPSFLWASDVAYSRMFLGVHYPTDILGGIVIGVGSSLLCHIAFRGVK
jgi:membrane-associated phospholipid phosphatase